MIEAFEDDFKKQLIKEIKDNIIKYEIEYQNNGNIKYSDSNNSCNQKTSNTIAIIWSISFISMLFFIIYKEGIIPFNMSISVVNYLIMVITIIIFIIISAIITEKKLRSIQEIILSKKDLTIYVYNNHLKTKEKYLYNNNEIKLDFKSRKQPKRRLLRNDTYEIYITYFNKIYKYLLHIKNEPKFFAFLLFEEFFINNLNIKELSDDQLYKMYHTKKYGLQ